MPKIFPFLWFDKEAEEAANFYVSVFPNSKLGQIDRYPEGAPGEAVVALPPGGTDGIRYKNATQLAIIRYAGIEATGIFVIDHDLVHHAMRESAIRGGVMREGVVTGKDSPMIGGYQHVIGISRIDEHIVDDNVICGHQLPLDAAVRCLPHATGRTGINNIATGGILLQHSGTNSGVGQPLHAMKQFGSVVALVDSEHALA